MFIATLAWLLAAMTAVSGDILVYTQEIPHTIEHEIRDMPADFGPDIPLEGLRGFLVAGEPPDGCSNVTAPPAVDNFTGRWMVLLAKSSCTFEAQVRNAQAAGFDAAIVHNVNSSELEIMTAFDPDGIVITAVFVSDIDGLRLTKYLYTDGFYIMVNSELPFNINTHLLLPFAIVVVLCLLVIVIFMIVKCINDRRRARRHRLPNRALKKIPTCKFSKGDPYDTCAICLDDYQEGERLRVLPCAHAYHAACIDPWLTQNKRVCPVCKRRVFAAGERRRLLSDSTDSDTEPLLAEPPRTQGGTFDDQRENPFARATRFMNRLRARANGEEVSASPPNEEHISAAAANDENGNTADTAPLLPAVRAVSERRRSRPRARNMRVRTAPPPAPPADSSDRGEIGVAALPAARVPPSPRHVDL